MSFSVDHVSGRLARHAGSSPKTMPVTSESAKAKARTRQSGAVSMSSGRPSVGMNEMSVRVSPMATSRPSAPPVKASSRLSTSSCRTSCPREAPSDRRTAISRWRMKARAMSRLATFAHAMSSTRPTIDIRTRSGVEKSLRSDE